MLKVLGDLCLLWSWQGADCYVLVSCLRPLLGFMNNKILFVMLSSGSGWLLRLWCFVFCREHNKLRSSMTVNVPCATSAINPHDTIHHLNQNPPYKTYKVLILPLTSAERHHTSGTQKQMCLMVSVFLNIHLNIIAIVNQEQSNINS